MSGNKRILKKIVRSELAKLSPSPRRVLDLGCGTGLLSPVFADDVYTGIDIDPKYIELARGNYPNKSFLISGGQKLHFPDGHFDFVLLSCTLHHTDDTMAQNILSEVRRILRKPNGRCLLIDNIQPIKKNFLSSWYANRDEGDFIRTKDAYKKLV
ncbi:MAG: class I SAM-dependent methyltransferase, partial [Patescibacteria group bacterium]